MSVAPSAVTFEPNEFVQHAAFLGEPDLQAVLRVLRELGFADVPARCKELSAERFNHAPAILNQFQVYARSYRPNKLGTLPAVFKDVATLDLGAQEFNANAINAANAAYQNQLNQLNAQIGSLLGGGGGGNNPSGGSNPSGDIFTPGAGTPGDVTPTMVGDTPVFNI